MIKLFFFIFFGLVSTNEHWFIFDQYQFPGFQTPLFTLSSSDNKSLSFTFSTYDRSILVDYNNETIKLNIERADLLSNAINHMIFIAIRNENKLETYVNCKLIDSYLFYSLISNNDNFSYKIKTINTHIQHYEIMPTSELTQQEIFDIFSCKQINTTIPSENQPTTEIQRPLIRKMQHVIEKVQQRKLRSR